MYLEKGLVYLYTKKFLLPLLHFWNYNLFPNGQIISFIGAQTSILGFLFFFAGEQCIMFPCICWERPSFTFCPGKKYHIFGKKNAIFADNTRKIMCRRGPFWEDHLFRKFEENIIFPCIFSERSSFIFRLRCKIIFSGKRNIIFPDNTRKIIFQHNFLERPSFQDIWEKKYGFPCSDNILYGIFFIHS